MEEKGRDTHLGLASFVEVLNRGKKKVGEAVWIEKIEEVMSKLVFLKKCLMERQDVSLGRMPIMNSLKS